MLVVSRKLKEKIVPPTLHITPQVVDIKRGAVRRGSGAMLSRLIPAAASFRNHRESMSRCKGHMLSRWCSKGHGSR